jgi:prepilin-type N-terminal cleavage/methylation domain-containing protein
VNFPRNKGFTVTEVLIVIGVIAVLAGILFPVVRGVLRNAHEVRCRNNLKEIGVALHTFCQDHNGRLPDLQSMRKSRNAEVKVLETVLADYLENPEVFHCPADNEFYRKSGSSYAWNNLMSNAPRESMNMFGINKVSKIPLAGDKEAFHGGENGTMFLYGNFSTDNELKFTTGGGALGYARK